MSVTADGDPRKEVTLAVALAAFERLADPATVFADAREWSRYVGVIGNDPDAVRAALDAHGLTHDIELGDRDKWQALDDLRATTGTDRHVYVGLPGEDERIAAHTGWEFRPVEEAAEKAGWALAEPDAEEGLLGRLRAWLGG